MTPRQVKRLREKILSEGYYRDRMYEMAELKADFEAESLLYSLLTHKTSHHYVKLFVKYDKRVLWYANKIKEQCELRRA